MVSGSEDEVKQETLAFIRDGVPGRGYIISTDHSLHDYIPEKNVWVFINTEKKYGRYPLEF